jgi:hypothetical protein
MNYLWGWSLAELENLSPCQRNTEGSQVAIGGKIMIMVSARMDSAI